MFPAPAKCIDVILPSLFIIEASVDPAPISKIAKGVFVPGVVKAPLIAMSASTPPTSTGTPNFSSSLLAIICIWSLWALTIAAIPTAFSIENSFASPPLTFWGIKVSTANKSWIFISEMLWLVKSAITCLTFSSIPPTLEPASPLKSSIGEQRLTASIILSAPSSTSTDSFLLIPVILILPAGIFFSLTSPWGVFITTADLFPEPCGATSTAAFISTGTFSKRETSSTIGIFLSNLLLINTPSSFWTMAAVILIPLLVAWFILNTASKKLIFPKTNGIKALSSSLISLIFKVSKVSNLIVLPIPTPNPPGVDGLCPIIVDSVIIVSVIVSIATSPITGAASLILTKSKSSKVKLAFFKAWFKEAITPLIFSLIPVVGIIPLDRNSTLFS